MDDLNRSFRNVYLRQSFSWKRRLSLGGFLGLITFVVCLCMEALDRSILGERLPGIMQDSSLAALYVYLHVSVIFNVTLFVIRYEYMSFVEILRNRWYPLVQLGHRPHRLIAAKLMMRVAAQAYIYVIGFGATMLLTTFMQLPWETGGVINLFLAGLMDVVLLSTAALAASLLFRNVMNARCVVVLLGVGVLALNGLAGFGGSLDTAADGVYALFDDAQAACMVGAGVAAVGCAALCILYGGRLARVFNPPMLRELPKLVNRGEDTVVLARDARKKRRRDVAASSKRMPVYRRIDLPGLLVNTVLTCAIVLMVLLNAVVLGCGLASPEDGLLGVIPYVFQSETMSPTIMYNDLAFFQRVDAAYPLTAGQVALFKDDAGKVAVARIQAIEDADGTPTCRMAVDHALQTDQTAQAVGREQVYGVFRAASRWLGVIVLFANTLLGRILLLLIPTFLIFFYDSIIRFVKTLCRTALHT